MAKRNGCDTCKSIWNWILQLFLWGSIIFLIVAIVSNQSQVKTSIITLSVIWLIYVINALCSSTCSYLKNNQENNTIHSYMLSLFKERPTLSFHVTCYHHENRHHTTRDKDGKVTHHTERVRINTWSESRNFHYISSRDISGIFRLDCEAIRENPEKYFIKLNLNLDVRKSDDGTTNHYIHQRDSFYNSNRWRDTHMDTSENTNLSGFNEYNLVSIANEKPTCVNLCCFVLFTLIGFVQFYKWYVDSYCIKQEYTIVKEISSTRNLNAQEFHCNYAQFNPSIIIKTQVLLNLDDPSQLPVNSSPINDLPDANEVNNQNNDIMTNQSSAFSQQNQFNNQGVKNYSIDFQNNQELSSQGGFNYVNKKLL